MKFFWISTALVAVLVLGVAGRAAGERAVQNPDVAPRVVATSRSGKARAVVVRIEKYQFQPAHLKVKTGTTVRWENHEKRTNHSVWFKQEGLPDSNRFFPEEYWERTFDKPGVYRYTCEPHPEMNGIIEVVD